MDNSRENCAPQVWGNEVPAGYMLTVDDVVHMARGYALNNQMTGRELFDLFNAGIGALTLGPRDGPQWMSRVSAVQPPILHLTKIADVPAR